MILTQLPNAMEIKQFLGRKLLLPENKQNFYFKLKVGEIKSYISFLSSEYR